MSLGQSARLCPDLEAQPETALPEGHPLDTRSAFAFLTEKALLLEQAGFGVMLPAWWSGRGTKMRLSARAQVKSPKMPGGSGLNLDQIVRFDWQLALGDEDLSLAELQELAERKSPLVKVRGQWVQLNAEEIQTALDLWRKRAGCRDHRPGGPATGFGRSPNAGRPAICRLTAEGWIGDLLAQLHGQAAFAELPPPGRFSRHAPALPGAGLFLAGFLEPVGPGRLPGRRHGAGQDDPDPGPASARERASRPARSRSCWSAPPPWWATGRRRWPLYARSAGAGPPWRHPRQGASPWPKQAEQHAMVISSYALLHRDLEHLDEIPLGRGDPGRGAEHQEPGDQAGAGGPRACRPDAAWRSPARRWKTTSATCGRSWSSSTPASWASADRASSADSSSPSRPTGTPRPPSACKRLTGPFILRRLKTDPTVITDLPGEDRDEGLLHPDQGAGLAVRAAVVDEAATVPWRRPTGIAAQGRDPGHAHQAQAGLQPPRPVPGGQLPGCRAAPASWPRLTEMLEEVLRQSGTGR